MSETIVVEGYPDLAADRKLSLREADAVSIALRTIPAREEYLVAWVEDWVLADKDLDPVESGTQVVSGRIEAETDKAYLLADGRDQAWLPKSVMRVYRAAPDADLAIPQRQVSDFAGGER